MTEHLIGPELHETANDLDSALAEYQAMLKIDAMRVDPYRKLYALYLTKKTYDEAWCLAAALAFLRQAGEEEKQFFEDYRPQGLPSVTGRVDNTAWGRYLIHEEEDHSGGKIFEALAPAGLRYKVQMMAAK